MAEEIECIDGGGCHIASLKPGMPACKNWCGVHQARAARTWPYIVALSDSGFAPAMRVVERANHQIIF